MISNLISSEVLRKVIRRCLWIGSNVFKLQDRKNWLIDLCQCNLDILGDTFPEIIEKWNIVKGIIESETHLYEETNQETEK